MERKQSLTLTFSDLGGSLWVKVRFVYSLRCHGTTDVIGNRSVLSNENGTNGILEKRSARIIAKGYAQQYGRDFHETYASVARLNSVKTKIALAATNRMHIRQLDVATASLNGTLEEEVFMQLRLPYNISSKTKVTILKLSKKQSKH